MSFSSERTVKSVRKRHVCDGCGKYIDAGGPATRWAGLTDGDFGTAIYHPDCRAAEIAYNWDILDFGHGDDWFPINEIDQGDWPWLFDAFPEVARRMGISFSAEDGAGSPAEGRAGNPATDEPNPELSEGAK